MRWVAIAVLVVSCGGTDGPDLDGDGLTDADDPCQAGPADDAIDADGDGAPASADACPHDASDGGDADGDGIPDACDPFPVEATPDTERCVTAFADRDVTAGYLAPRAGETSWELGPPLSAAGAAASVVSAFPATDRSTSYDVLGTATFATTDASARVVLWLRAVDAPSTADLGCVIDGAGDLYILANGERTAPRPLPAPLAGPFRLRATVQTGSGTTVLCRVTVGGQSITTTTGGSFAPGTFGFAASGATATIESLVVYGRDTSPPL